MSKLKDPFLLAWVLVNKQPMQLRRAIPIFSMQPFAQCAANVGCPPIVQNAATYQHDRGIGASTARLQVLWLKLRKQRQRWERDALSLGGFMNVPGSQPVSHSHVGNSKLAGMALNLCCER